MARSMTPATLDHAVTTQQADGKEPASAIEQVACPVRAPDQGLKESEVASRRVQWGFNETDAAGGDSTLRLVLSRFKNPLLILLLAAAVLSAYLHEYGSAIIIGVILIVSAAIELVQERRAGSIIRSLRDQVAIKARALRDGRWLEIPARELVPGDVIALGLGSVVPADAVVVESKDLSIDEAALSGESMPVMKQASPDGEATEPLPDESRVFQGTAVVGGSGTAMVTATGRSTQFAALARIAAEAPPAGPLERGTREFGAVLLWLTGALVAVVFVVSIVIGRAWVESLLFAAALAVGIAPELLPMIVSVTLAHGAVRMAAKHVIVKRPPAIYALGSIDVLCTDKTGTLTQGAVSVVRTEDAFGAECDEAMRLAYLSVALQEAPPSAIDNAIRRHKAYSLVGVSLVNESPFNFVERTATVTLKTDVTETMVTRGAPEALIARCSRARRGADVVLLSDEMRADILHRIDTFGAQCVRVIAITAGNPHTPTNGDALSAALTLVGFIGLHDQPKPDAKHAVRALERDGVQVKILTGDSSAVARAVCEEIGFHVHCELNNVNLTAMSDDALDQAVDEVNLFTRVTPEQKYRIVAALRRRGHRVGFLGDGINDAPALTHADVGISVDSAVDVAKEAASLILLTRALGVIHAGVIEGRRTYANIMKYVVMASSSNLGNMISVAVAAAFLPFLPMLPPQILLNNLLYDLSELGIPFDHADPSMLRKPCEWNTASINRFMWTLGPVSSIFDLLTFGVLLWLFRFDADLFRTGWFVESIATQVLVVFVIRTQGRPWHSAPHPMLVASSLTVVACALLLPATPLASFFGFVSLPATYYGVLLVLVTGYLIAVELAKQHLRNH